MWQILAISVAIFVAENKKPPENQEVLSHYAQSVGESCFPLQTAENLQLAYNEGICWLLIGCEYWLRTSVLILLCAGFIKERHDCETVDRLI